MNGLRLLRGGVVPGDLVATWGGAALAEITHSPTGLSGLDLVESRLEPGESTGFHHHGSRPTLLTVLEGHLTVSARHGGAVGASPGDAVAVGPWLEHAETAGSGVTRYLIYGLEQPAARVPR